LIAQKKLEIWLRKIQLGTKSINIMKNQTYLLFFCIFLICNPNLFSQEESIPPSTEPFKFISNFESEQGLFTGSLNITIPLYTIHEKGIEIPIYLNYNAKGLQPKQDSPQIGVGWGLVAGGFITRIVNKLPDDVNRVYRELPGDTGDEHLNVGFINSGGTKAEIMYNTDYDDWDMNNNQCLDYIFYAGFNALDTEPDKFTIQFPGFVGEFYLDKDGNPHVDSSSEITIIVYRAEGNNGLITSFEVHDLSGNRYFFDKIERTINLNYPIFGDEYLLFMDDSTKPFGFPFYDQIALYGGFNDIFNNTQLIDSLSGMSYISTWYLSKIVTPSANNIEFNYISIINETDEKVIDYAINKWMSRSGNVILQNQIFPNFRMTRKLLPWGITWNGGEIKFSYTNTTLLLKHFTINDRINDKVFGFQFDHSLFDVTDSQQDYESLNFNGESLLDYTTWYRLDKVFKFTAAKEIDNRLANGISKMYTDFIGFKQNNNGYILKYNNHHPFPNRLTTEKDFWGFYNGNNSASSFPTVYNIDPETQYNQKTEPAVYSLFNDAGNSYPTHYEGADRNSSFEYIQTGILEKIIYPTGGETLFQYELNDFVYNGVTRQGAGLRIAKITQNPVSGYPIIKEFDYLNSTQNNTSGKIIDLPVFYHYNTKDVVTNYNVNDTKVTHGSFIGYSEVTVKEQGKGFVQYLFDIPATFEENSDDCDNGNCVFDRPQGMIVFDCVDCSHEPSNALIPAPNYDWNRGQLLKKTEKDELGNIVAESINRYETSITNEIPYIFSKNKITYATDDCKICHIKKQRLTPSIHSNKTNDPSEISYLVGKTKKLIANKLLKEKRTMIYGSGSPNDSFQKKYLYNYNDFNQLISQESVLSNGKVELIKYFYLKDIEDPNEVFMSQEIYNSMIDKRLNNTILKTEKYIDAEMTESQIISFDSFNGDTPLPKAEMIFEDGSFKVKVNYDYYDSRSNLVQYHHENNNYYTTIWGYNYQYPVAKIENAEYSFVMSQLNILYSDLQTKTSEQLLSIFNTLRQKPEMSDKSVYSYTYDPLVGMTSETDPNGITTIYAYDDFGRLETIRDKDFNVLKHVDYNYGFNATLNTNPNYTHGEIVTFSLSVQGGSGSFSYNWNISANGQTILTGSESSIRTQLTESGSYSINCVIVDNESGYSKTLSGEFEVLPIECKFINVVTEENYSSANLQSPLNEIVTMRITCSGNMHAVKVFVDNNAYSPVNGMVINAQINNSGYATVRIEEGTGVGYVKITIESLQNNTTVIGGPNYLEFPKP